MRYLPVMIHTLAGMLTLLGSTLALAQGDAKASSWYRVEVLIFSQQADASSRREQFDPEPSLKYPGEVRFLMDPLRVAANEKAHMGSSSTLDSRGRQLIDDNVIADPETDIPPPMGTMDAASVTASIGPDVVVPGATDPNGSEPLLTPRPFVIRNKSELEFRGKAAYMERRGGYRTLFHETWLQPMAEREQSPAIVLDHSGDDQNYPLLQGSIKLYLARYLHLETNLWVNTDGSYLSHPWQMPAPPLSPASLIVTEIEEPASAINYYPSATAAASDQAPDPNATEVAATGPHYPFRHAVKLQQQARMRGSEVHYLDHPLLGLVIKLMPLSEEDLDTIARSDAAASAGQPQ